MSTPPDNKQSALQRLYARQQPKMKTNQRTANVLRVYADDNYKAIAKVIQQWMAQDEKKRK